MTTGLSLCLQGMRFLCEAASGTIESAVIYEGRGNLKKAHRTVRYRGFMIRMESVPAARQLASALLRCGLSVAFVAAALGVTLLLQGSVSTAGFVFFYTAV